MQSLADTASPSRLSIVTLAGRDPGAAFYEAVRAGLSARPKTIHPKYFYDELGSLLFEAICALPEYYVTRAEDEILTGRAGEIVASLTPPVHLFELGSGSSAKTRSVVEALLDRQDALAYSPIDISESAIRMSCDRLLRRYPRLSIRAFVGDYLETLAALPERDPEAPGTILVLFLGSTIGNLDPPGSVELLRAVRRRLAPGDALLLGADLKKPEAILVPAYDDPLGVTAAFNLNLLARINRELGGEFDLARFSHRAVWNEAEGRMEMHIVSRAAQTVAVRGLGLEARFEAGETILSECSYKFDDAAIAGLAGAAGFAVSGRWTDPRGLFSSYLLTAVPA